MKKAAFDAVTVEKPKVLFLVAVNTLNALFTQTVFACFMLRDMKALEGIIPSGYSEDAIDALILSALFLNCIITALVLGAVTYSFERFPLLGVTKLSSKEFLRASYYSISAMVWICAIKLLGETDAIRVFGLIVLALILFALAGYHSRFGEARKGIWFPYIIFQLLLQRLIFFPLGWWIVGRSL